MGTIMIFLRMRRPGADGARREPARMGRRRASRRRIDVGRDVRRRDRAVRVVLDAVLAAQIGYSAFRRGARSGHGAQANDGFGAATSFRAVCA